MNEYDEFKAAAAMRAAVAGAEVYDDDQLINLIDIIFDYYDENGDLEIDNESDNDDDDIEAMTEYAVGILAKDKGNRIAKDHIRPLIEAEIEYELSLI